MTAIEAGPATAATVRAALRAAVDTLPAPARTVAGYHRGWLDEHGAPADAPAGKSIRPAFVLAAARATGGRGDPVPAAVAVELVHDFSLLHDDVMDGDRTRRHRPTAWTVFGVGPAVLAGDALLTLALDLLRPHGAAATVLAAAVQELIDGQLTDLAFEERNDVTLDECLAMADGKTAALLGCSTALGAILAGAEPERVRVLMRAGRELGLAFQIVDDLLGIWGDPAVTGKPVGADLARRKKTIPVVAALTSGTPAGAELAARYAGTGELDTRAAAQLVAASGAQAWCHDRIAELRDRAVQRIRAAGSGDPTDLLALARRVTERRS
ncbi:polyprenyl synthetase family protein [Pseudonocardia sp. CA-107938]|uniref:polyprenyl synthetase family protein n=1 Tax=Pseudonocardia sp. CA-107938 TaxID=3240021 RepID=UPI003D8B2840